MPIVDFEARISSRFQCPRPADAAPNRKRDHVMPAVFDVRAPHVRVDCVIGTRGSFVERVDSNYYQGHVPDSPVLLGQAQLEQYRAGEKACGWGVKRLIATGAAVAVGAVLGTLMAATIMGAAAVAHLIWPATFAALTVADWVVPIVAWAFCGAFLCVLNDWPEWSAARTTFSNLRQMAECAVALDAEVRRPQENQRSAYLVNFARTQSVWVTQQAGLELEAARERAGMGPVANEKNQAA